MTDVSTAGAETQYTVFISSPSDVGDERDRVKSVLEQLNAEFAGRFKFDWISWPDGYYTAHEHFQTQLRKPSACHIVVCVLWSRLGTKLPAEFNRHDGTARTGTEYEFEEALEAALKNNAPDILMYRKINKTISIDTDHIAEQQAQLSALEAFWRRWFRDENGRITAGFDSFDTSKEFTEKLKRHLRLWLESRYKQSIWPISVKGSPYRSLGSFDADHADVFFGRRKAIRQVIARLQTRALEGCAFVVVLGMSGVGKSSLVKAGVVPWLIFGRVASDVDEWRSCVIRCDLLIDDPALHLSEALFESNCLPELASGDYYDPGSLAALMREAPRSAVSPIAAALRRAGDALRVRKALDEVAKVNIVVVFDQLEALLLDSSGNRDIAIALMDALARSGSGIAVIATLRSDYYAEFQANPGLMSLKTDGASFDLAPPNALEINEIIEGPAHAAGLGLQQDGDHDLATLLNRAAAKPGSLPLLEFTLESLFEGRDQVSNTLLLKTYADLGGMEGAIAVEAERLVTALPASLQAALPSLLLALVDIDETRGISSASARTIWRSAVTDPHEIELADRLIAGRFLIADESGAGATLRLAHEALLGHWPRLSALIASESQFLGTRRRLHRDAQIWEREEQHGDFLLPPGRRVTDAAALLAERPEQFDANTGAYIKASGVAATTKLALDRMRNRRRLHTQLGVGALAAMVVFASTLIIADQQRRERTAVANGKVDQLIQARRYSEVIPIAIAALPSKIDGSTRRAEHELVAKLRYAIDRNRLKLTIAGLDHSRIKAAFDYTGAKVLASSSDGKLGVWDTKTGALLLGYGPRGVGCCAVFDPAGTKIIIAATNGQIEVRNAKTWKLDGTLTSSGVAITSLSFDPSGALLVSGAADGVVRSWRTQTFAPVAKSATGGGRVNAIAFCTRDRWFMTFSSDGKARRWAYDGKAAGAVTRVAAGALSKGALSSNCARAVAVSGPTVWVWRPSAGDSHPIQTGQPIDEIAISVAGDRIVTASHDSESAILWNSDTAQRVAELASRGRVQSVAFSPVDDRVATTAFNDWTAVWDGRNGTPLSENFVLRDGAAFNRQVLFSPEGGQILTVSDAQSFNEPALRLWNAGPSSTGRTSSGEGAIAVGAPVRRALFSPDQRWIATGGADGLVRFWNAQSLAPVADMAFIRRDGPVYDLAFDPQSLRLATASGDGSADIWNLTSRALELPLPAPAEVNGRKPWANRVSFDATGKRIAIAYVDSPSATGEALIADTTTGLAQGKLLQESREIWTAVFDESGTRIVTASENHNAAIWNADTGQRLLTLDHGHSKALNWAGFSHKGDKVVTVSDDGSARLWSTVTGKGLGGPLVNDEGGMVIKGAFNPDDSEVVTSTSTGRLYYWSVATGKLLAIKMVDLNDQILYDVGFDAKGQRIAVASHDGSVRVFASQINPTSTLEAGRDIAKRVRPNR